MLIIVRLIRFIFPLVVAFLLFRVLSPVFYRWMAQGRPFEESRRSSSPPPPGGRSFRDPYEIPGVHPGTATKR